MAMIRFRVTHLKVRSGRGAARVVQYLTREERYAPEQAQVAYLRRTSPATAHRDDLVHQEVMHLPAWAHGDAAGFFARAEQHERVNGRYATSWQLALPRELDREAQVAMARDFLAVHLADKPTLWVLHDPVNAEGEHQPHLHVLFSERTNDGMDRGGPADHFRRYNAAHPERGGCQKDAWFKQRNAVYEIRAAWCDWTNYTLERAGLEGRIHPSSLYAQGIERRPEPKVGPGQDPHVLAERARIRQQRDLAREQAVAAQGWEARKGMLGISDVQQMPAQQFVQQTMLRARNVQPGQWVPGMPSAEEQAQARLAQQQAQREQATHRLATEIRIMERRAGREPRTEAEQWARLQQPLIGNGQSQIYHAPGDPNYGEVVPQHQILFWSHGEAEAAGYREAMNQHYGVGADTPMATRLREAREARQRTRERKQALARLTGRDAHPDPIRTGLRANLREEEWEHGRTQGYRRT